MLIKLIIPMVNKRVEKGQSGNETTYTYIYSQLVAFLEEKRELILLLITWIPGKQQRLPDLDCPKGYNPWMRQSLLIMSIRAKTVGDIHNEDVFAVKSRSGFDLDNRRAGL